MKSFDVSIPITLSSVPCLTNTLDGLSSDCHHCLIDKDSIEQDLLFLIAWNEQEYRRVSVTPSCSLPPRELLSLISLFNVMSALASSNKDTKLTVSVEKKQQKPYRYYLVGTLTTANVFVERAMTNTLWAVL